MDRRLHGWNSSGAGRRVVVSLALANGEGEFVGRLDRDETIITGHWTSPSSKVHGFRYAAPVRLEAHGPNRWRGEVDPRDDDFTLYLMVQKRPDGTIAAFIRNPERNIGLFNNVDSLERAGDTVRLIGRQRGAKTDGVLFTAQYDRENGILAMPFPDRGGTYDFRRDRRSEQRLLSRAGESRAIRLSAAAGARRWLADRDWRTSASIAPESSGSFR